MLRRDDEALYKLYRKVLLEADSSQEQGIQRKMAPEELHNFKALLTDCKRSLATVSPYLYRMLDHLHVVPTFDIETMAVDNKNNIYINPDFAFQMEARNKDEVTGVLAHEVLHHENRTFSRQEWRDPQLWNIATDFIMNRDLIVDGFKLPEEGCIPQFYGNNKVTVKTLKPTFKVEEEIDITNATCEFLYNRLAERIAAPPGGGGEGEGEGQGKGKSQRPIVIGGKDGKKISKTFDEHLTEGIKINPATDDPNLQPNSGDSKEIERELIKAKEEASIATELDKDKFVRDAQASGPSIGRKLERQKALKRGGINWRAVLQDNLKKTVESQTRTYGRLNRRALGTGRIVPGTKPDIDKPEIVIALDSSGSISNKTLHTFLDEVMKITTDFQDYSIQIIVYSTKINDTFVITPHTKQKIVSKLRAGTNWEAAGNNESCIKEWLDKNGMKKLDLFILFTDGGVNSKATLPFATKTYFMVLDGNPTDILMKLNPSATVVWVNLPNKIHNY
jgi:predicted metal-dependent peptidase